MKNTILDYIIRHNIVCPKPIKWNELWQMLPEKERVGVGWRPALPLILASWYESSNSQKHERFLSHINYAEEKGVLDQVDKFIRSLKDDQWIYEGDV